MKILQKLLLLFVFIFSFNSCDKDDSVDAITLEDLDGVYKYYVSEGYFQGEYVGQFKKEPYEIINGEEYYAEGLNSISFEDGNYFITYNGICLIPPLYIIENNTLLFPDSNYFPSFYIQKISSDKIMLTVNKERQVCGYVSNSDEEFDEYKGVKIYQTEKGQLYYKSNGQNYCCWAQGGLFVDVKWEKLKKQIASE